MDYRFPRTARLAVTAGLAAALTAGSLPMAVFADVAQEAPAQEDVATSETELAATPAVEQRAGANVSPVAEAKDGAVNSYETLTAAINAAPDGVETSVKLESNLTFTDSQVITIPAQKKIVLDMNEKSITCSGDYSGRPITNEGTLTVTGEGTIDTSMSLSGGYGAINNKGKLTILNGTYRGAIYASGAVIRNTGASADLTIKDGLFEDATSAVFNEGTATIDGGTFLGETCSQCNGEIWAYTIRNNAKESNMVINDGYFEGVQGAVSAAIGNLEVNGGTFKTVKCKKNNKHTATFYALYAAGEIGQVKLLVNGGHFETEGNQTAAMVGNDNKNGDGGINEKATAEIKGGTFVAPEGVPALKSAAETGDPVISGGTFSSKIDEKYFADGFKQNADGSVVNRYVASVGDKKYESLAEAVKEATSGSTIKLLQDITLPGGYTDNTEAGLVINKGLTIDGDGHTIDCGTFKRGIRVYGGDSADKLNDVQFKNVTIKSDVAGGRCIETREGYFSLTLDNVGLKGLAENSQVQPLTIGGSNKQTSTVVIRNESNIEAASGGYGIVAFNPIELTIDNSSVSGYAALYLKGENDSEGAAGSKVQIKNGSTLSSENPYPGDKQNGFGTIVFEDNNITVKVTDSTLNAKATGTAEQSIFSFVEEAKDDDSNPTCPLTGIEVSIVGNTTVNMTGENTNLTNITGDNTVAVSGGTFSKKINPSYIVPGSGLMANADGTFGVHKHTGTKVASKAPTATEPGNIEYWVCSICNKLFTNEAMTVETTIDKTVIPAKGEEPAEKFTVTVIYGNGQPDGKFEVVKGEKFAKPADPEPLEGYEFAGWFTVGGEDGKLSGAYDFDEPVIGDLTIYAGWTPVATEDEKPTVAPDNEKDEVALPKTGDDSALPMVVAAGAGVIALAAGAVALKRRQE